MLKIRFQIALFLALFLAFLAEAAAQGILLSPQEVNWIGERVFENECASKDENLIVWNEGEDFMSLGIGHFIWHPANGKDFFEESFVRFLEYAESSGEQIPGWLDTAPFPACPWSSREGFLVSAEDARLIELKQFLIKTKPLQTAFIIKRLEEALPLILNSVSEEKRNKITLQFHRVASTPLGVYVLADCVNFK